MAISDIFQYITGSLAAVGAVLGVLNTWNAFDRQRVKLIVRPATGFSVPDFSQTMLTVDVINMSAFPVTITEIGFNRQDGDRYITFEPLTNGQPLPQRVESRDSLSAYFPLHSVDPKTITVAFARTSCGEIATGDSPALKQARTGETQRLLGLR